MKTILIEAGEDGIGQKALVMKCRTKQFDTQVLKEILEAWRLRDLVQKFYVKKPHSKKPITIWRGTTLLLTEHL